MKTSLCSKCYHFLLSSCDRRCFCIYNFKSYSISCSVGVDVVITDAAATATAAAAAAVVADAVVVTSFFAVWHQLAKD